MDNNDIARAARERMDEAWAADLSNRDRAENDLGFVTGIGQWPESVRTVRESEGRPCLTVNRLPVLVGQVTEQIRNLNPAIEVVLADNDANEDVAEVIAGLVRHIEHEADATSIYEQAAESAAACGMGFWRVRADFAEGDTFDQELLIERIHNPFAVFFDPMAKHPTRKDAEFCFIADEMRVEDFRAAYPDASLSDITSGNRPATDRFSWFTPDTVTVAEYYWVETTEHTIGLLPSGEIVRDPPAPLNVIKKRKVKEPSVKWAKVTGSEVIEGPLDIPSRWIPVFAVTGTEWHLGEETYRSSLVRFAKDPQQLYNYSRSAHAEMVAIQPKAPYIGTTDQFAGLEAIWAAANKTNAAYLPYKADRNAPGAPQRVPPPVPSTGLLQEIALAADDIKHTTGIFDAALGNDGQEVSGVAIQRRQSASQNGSSVYADNMVKAILQTGRVIVDMIPAIYDTSRVIRVLNADGQDKIVAINAVMQDRDGAISVNDVTRGTFDVKISVGPSKETQREAAADGMTRFIAAFPQAAGVTADLVATAQDWPDKDKFAARLRKVLPPGVLDDDELTDEERQAQQQAQQQAQRQSQRAAQLEEAQAMAEVRRDMATAAENEADARKTQVETAQAQFELAVNSGLLDAAIQAAVQRALQGTIQ